MAHRFGLSDNGYEILATVPTQHMYGLEMTALVSLQGMAKVSSLHPFYPKDILASLKENTILVFFSDHGTGIGERFGERNYGSFTYEETIKTFFLFMGKDIIKNRINEKLRENIDIFPTILELIGTKTNYNGHGESFCKYLDA